jgi:hypothetical protein
MPQCISAPECHLPHSSPQGSGESIAKFKNKGEVEIVLGQSNPYNFRAVLVNIGHEIFTS